MSFLKSFWTTVLGVFSLVYENTHIHCFELKEEISERSGPLLLESRDKQGHLPCHLYGGKSPVGQSPGPFWSLPHNSCSVLAGSIQSGIVGSVLLFPCQQGIQAFLTGAHHMAPAPLQGPDSPSSRTHVVWPTAIFTAAAHSLCVTVCVYPCSRYL